MRRSLCCLAFAATLMAAACRKPPPAGACVDTTPAKSIDSFLPYQPLTGLVNPMIGTTNGGNLDPSAMVPHGVVRLGPDTNENPKSVSSYGYGDTALQGFSHTHFEGNGGSSYGYANLLVMATRGPIATTEAGYQTAYTHTNEIAQPGYYAVDLPAPAARAELTATRLCGVHRYTFSAGAPGNILLDLAHTRGEVLDGQVEIVGNTELRGHAHYEIDPLISFLVSNVPGWTGSTGQRTIYFDAHFSRPFDTFGTWENGVPEPGSRAGLVEPLGAFATFNAPDTSPIELSVCLSAISEDQAALNYQSQIGTQNFDAVHAAATDAWNKILNRIQVQGGTPAQQQQFYTGLFRTLGGPADYTEDCQFWNGEDGAGTVLNAPDWHYYTDDWCMWDTFRTVHPLETLIEPERRSDIVRSILVGYERGGWLTRCSWAGTGYSREMTALPFAPIIVDAWEKGFRGYDANEAWQALWKASMQDATVEPPLCGYLQMGTPPEYVTNGWVSHECDQNQSASLTLEYAYQDWALARLADGLGQTAERDQLDQLAGNYRNVFNPAVNFMQGRHADGGWVEPFDPTSSTDFTESSSWIDTWMVPHDHQGLINLIGGPTAFVAKLDEFFDGGYANPGNEPGFGVPYGYVYAGAPAKTQAQVRSLLAKSYNTGNGGLPGNDDSGAMSSYFVWGALGLYPVSPGDDTLLIASPIFDRATIYLEPNYYDGKTFVVETTGNGPGSPYVQSATLNGTPLTRPWLTFGDVVKGGVLSLQMGPEPSSWGADPADAPPSMTAQ